MDSRRWELVKTLFHDALAEPPATREQWLRRHCESDPMVDAEVRALLLAHDEAAPHEHQSHNPTTGPVGGQLGRYRIVSRLGEGGFGTVHLAEQSEPVHRQVALKVLRAGMDSAQVIERFKLERESLARMSHPNIAQIFDAGTTEHGLPFFAMEFVDGASLTPYCDQHRLGLNPRLQLFVQVCRGVHHAHQKGIIHRDLKPSNVLVSTVDGTPVPKIIDFGIAKATQGLADGALAEFRTLEGKCLGTPGYMSPEQADLEGGHVDVRSDVYSLGVLLYELLTGRLPHDPSDLRAGGLLDYLRRVREQEPRRPSTTVTGQDEAIAATRRATVTGLRHRLRGDLDWITLRALERDPTRRYQSADDIAEDLERHLRHEPVRAGPPGLGYRARKFVRRHRVVAASAVAIVLALVVGLAAALWQNGIAKVALREAIGHRLSAQAINLAAEDATLALLVALQGAERAPGEDADAALYAALGVAHEVRHEIVHDATVRWAAYSSDERCSLSADDTGLVRCLDLPAGTVRHTFDVHEAVMAQLAVDARGECGASIDQSGLLLLLDLRDGTVQQRVELQTDVCAAQFLPSGDLLAAGVDGRLLRIDAHGSIAELARYTAPLETMQVAPDGATVAVLGKDEHLHRYDLDAARPLDSQALPSDAAHAEITALGKLQFSANAQWLVCLGPHGRTDVLHLRDRDQNWRPTTAPCTTLALAGDAGLLALFPPAETAFVVDLDSRRRIDLQPTNLHRTVVHAVMDPGGYTLATVLDNRPVIAVFDPVLGTHLCTLRGDSHALYSPHVSADGEWIDAYGHTGAVHRWRTGVFDEQRRMAQRQALGLLDAWLPLPQPGRALCWLNAAGAPQLALVDCNTGKALVTYHTAAGPTPRATLTPQNDALLLERTDGTVLLALDDGAVLFDAGKRLIKARCNASLTFVAGLHQDRVQCFDTRTGKLVFDRPVDGAQFVDVDAPGTRLATADGGSNTTTIWSIATGEVERVIEHRAFAFDAMFSADGRRVIALANDTTAQVVDVASGHEELRLRVPTADFSWLHVDPTGRYVAVQMPDETSVFDLQSGQRRLRWAPAAPGQKLAAMRLHSDGRGLLMQSRDGTQRTLPLDPVAAARAIAPRQLSAAERQLVDLPAAEPAPTAPPIYTSRQLVDSAIALLTGPEVTAERVVRAQALLRQAQTVRTRTQPRFHLARALAWSQQAAHTQDPGSPDQALDDLALCLRAGAVSEATIRIRKEFAALRATARGQQFLDSLAR